MTELLIIVALVLANGIFAGAEIAVVVLRKTRLRELVEQGRGSAKAVLRLREKPERFLATVQVGITVVGATAAAYGGASIAAHLTPVFADIPWPWLARHARGLAIGVVVIGVSFLSIVIGELVPKSLALRNAERYALFIAKPLLALSWLARPLVWLLSSSANLLLRPFGDRTTFMETRHSAEELQQLVEEATKAGTIHPEAGEIASRALELPELVVADVMVPRQDCVMISRRSSPEELRRILLEHTHSRIPVYEDRIDNVVGYISVKDVIALAWEQRLIVLEDIMRPPYFVPETKLAVELLKEMRNRHMPLAIIVDEQGGMSGIATMEDLLEELVGEIFSEHTSEVPELIRKESNGSAIVSGQTPIREVNRALDIELPVDGAWTTIAGLLLALFGKIPATGESLEVGDGIRLEVVDASPRRVRAVRLCRPVPIPQGEGGRS